MAEQSSRPHIRRSHSAEFDWLYPQRLTSGELEVEQPLSLMLRTPGEPFEAYEMSVKIEEIQRKLAATVLITVALDHDFRPIGGPLSSYLNGNNDWTAAEFYLQSKHGDIEIERGFFVPPQSDEIDNFLKESATLGGLNDQ